MGPVISGFSQSHGKSLKCPGAEIGNHRRDLDELRRDMADSERRLCSLENGFRGLKIALEAERHFTSRCEFIETYKRKRGELSEHASSKVTQDDDLAAQCGDVNGDTPMSGSECEEDVVVRKRRGL